MIINYAITIKAYTLVSNRHCFMYFEKNTNIKSLYFFRINTYSLRNPLKIFLYENKMKVRLSIHQLSDKYLYRLWKI